MGKVVEELDSFWKPNYYYGKSIARPGKAAIVEGATRGPKKGSKRNVKATEATIPQPSADTP